MRPCGFHSRKVANCVPTSTRLWTCIRSIRFVRRSAIERSIDLIPFSLPRVQTFGEKNFVANAKRGRQLANHVFGRTVHRGRIDYTATELYKKRKDVSKLAP